MATIRNYLAATAAIAMIAAGAAAAAPSARAATPSCGAGCIAFYNLIYGKSDVIAAVDEGGGVSQGSYTELTQESSSNQNEDWVLSAQDTVADFYYAGLISPDLNLHYGNDYAYEYEYAPDGVLSGLCLGVPTTAADGMFVDLEPCGVSAQTLWIADTADQYKRQIPFINGTDDNFANPLVLTADNLNDTITTSMLTGSNGVIDDGQYWGTEYGVLP